MSASNTNLEKQKKHHKGPLVGIASVVILAVTLFLGLLAWTAYKGGNPVAQSPAEVIAD